MKFRTKLYLGFGTIIVLLIMFSVIVFQQLSVMNQNMHGVVDDSYAKVKLTSAINADINILTIELNEALLDTDASVLQNRFKTIERYRYNLKSDMNELVRLVGTQPESKELFGKIEYLYNLFYQSNNDAIDLLKSGKKELAIQLHNNETEQIRIQLFQSLIDLKQAQEVNMDRSLQHSSNTYANTVRYILILVGLTILIGIAVAVSVFRSLTGSLSQIVSVMNHAARSERTRLPRIQIQTNDELGSITEAYNQMATALETIATKEEQHNLLLQRQSWHKSKIAEIMAHYQSLQDIDQLADMFITEAAAAIGASYGVFYLKEENVLMSPRLVKLAAYAGDREDIGVRSFAMGEGLVGQCALENRTIIVDNPPQDYMQIRSGLGSTPPLQIIITPVQFKQEVIAVIEMASIHRFKDDQLSLFNELLFTLGIAIKRIAGSMLVQKLLKEEQLFTAELQTQAEELQQQQEELQQQQEELKVMNELIEEQYKNSKRESKELENARDELEEKNRQIMQSSNYKSEFLANMSHELRTPLNSILILSQMMSENTEGNLSSKQLDYIRSISASGSDLLKLINDVLDLSKIESGKIEIIWDTVKLKGIAEMAERHFSAVALQKDIKFVVRMQEELTDITVNTDTQKLQQIVINLLSNAFKFTEQGSVSLLFRYASESEVSVHPGLTAEKDILAIEISDTGIGIANDKLDIIFDAFQQADGTTNRKYGGTGLGLSISQKFAGLLGGVISVDSEEGRGSTFTVYLPIDGSYTELKDDYTIEAAATITKEIQSADYPIFESEHNSVDSEENGKIKLKGKTILLVDDDMRNIYALTTVLESHGIKVIFAENGQEGIQQLNDHRNIDLVLMDIMMPKMDGYEAIKEIRKQKQHQDLPIIALTAKAMKYDREKCIDAGANDYISKPVNLEQLLSLIRVWLHE